MQTQLIWCWISLHNWAPYKVSICATVGPLQFYMETCENNKKKHWNFGIWLSLGLGLKWISVGRDVLSASVNRSNICRSPASVAFRCICKNRSFNADSTYLLTLASAWRERSAMHLWSLPQSTKGIYKINKKSNYFFHSVWPLWSTVCAGFDTRSPFHLLEGNGFSGIAFNPSSRRERTSMHLWHHN